MQEEWKRFNKVSNFGPDYLEVSSCGRVRSRKGDIKPMTDNGAGYLSFSSGRNTQSQYREYIHRAVAMAFIPNPSNLPQVNHKDCDKSNNCAFVS